MADNFKGNKKKFWNGVDEVRKGKSTRLLSVRNSMGEELTRENDFEVRWRRYFVQLLNDNKISEVGGRGLEGGG